MSLLLTERPAPRYYESRLFFHCEHDCPHFRLIDGKLLFAHCELTDRAIDWYDMWIAGCHPEQQPAPPSHEQTTFA